LTGKTPTGATPPGGNGLFIPKGNDAAHVAAAWDFIKFLSSASSDATWAANTGYIPIRTDATTTWKAKQSKQAYAWYDVAYEGLLKGKADTNTAGPMIGDYQDVSAALISALDGLTQSPWPSASSQLSAAANAANTAIAAYNSRL
jgi:sn-glycerol 3-phosphate transport system substrate-binding protein